MNDDKRQARLEGQSIEKLYLARRAYLDAAQDAFRKGVISTDFEASNMVESLKAIGEGK